MRLIIASVVAIIAAVGGCGQAASSQGPGASLILERSIDLPGVQGRIDHLSFDPVRGRLFVAALGNGTVEAVDLAKGQVAGRIAGLKEPQGLAYLPGRDELVVASADGAVGFYHAADLTLIGTLKVGEDADNVRLDAKSGRVVVGYGRGALASIDPQTRTVVATLPLPAHPESFRLDAAGERVFVNLPGSGQLAVGDLRLSKVQELRKAPHSAGYPMLLDEAGGQLGVVYRLPPRLVLSEAGTGRLVQDLDVCGDSDDLSLDAKRRRLYVSCGSGQVDVLQQQAGAYHRIGRVESRQGARTSLFVPQVDRLFVAARANGGRGAAILVFAPRE